MFFKKLNILLLMAWCLAYDNLAYGDMDAFEISCQDGLFFFFFKDYSCTNDKCGFKNCILNKY